MNEPASFTFEQDKLGRKPFSEKLEKFLMVEHDFVEGSLVISLNAPFGSGKTTFLSMWKKDLDERRQHDTAIPVAIMLNAWESDYCGDPLLPIVTALIRAVSNDHPSAASPEGRRLREAAKDVGWFATGLANSMVSKFTGMNPLAAAQLAEAKKEGRRVKKPDSVALYEERMTSLTKLKETLRDIFGGDIPKALVFVDELDRCRPDYAIEYLETIKHVFDVHGLVFVLAVDYEQLSCSARALFGQDMNVAEYLRRFVQRTLSLPEPDEMGLQKLTQDYATRIIEREGKRVSLMPLRQVDSIVQLISRLRMTPRQIHETFRIIGHVVAGDSKKRGRIYPCLAALVMLMSALKVADSKMYRLLGSGQADPTEVGDFLIKLLGPKDAYWWFVVYFTGSLSTDTKLESIEVILKRIGLVEEHTEFDARKELSHFCNGWGGFWGSKRLQEVYEKLETATPY